MVDETELVAGFYEAAFDAALFPGMLRRLGEFGRGVGAVLLLWDKRADRPALLATAGHTGSDAIDAYSRHYAPLDPYLPVLNAAQVGHWTTCTQFFDEKFVAKSAFYNDYLIPRGTRYMATARVMAAEDFDAFIGIHRGPGQAPYSKHELLQFERVGRHLGLAVKVHFDLGRARLEHEAAVVALERSATPAMLVDATGRVLFSNAAAEGLLKADEGIGVRQGRLAAGRNFEERRLQMLVAGATGAAGQDRTGGEMLVGRPAGGLPIALLIAPAGPITALHSLTPLPVALVLLHHPARYVTHPTKRLRALFGLTKAEAALAQGLLEGKRLTEIASGRGVSVETVRTQLRSLFKKTGVSRQADLMRILLAMPGML